MFNIIIHDTFSHDMKTGLDKMHAYAFLFYYALCCDMGNAAINSDKALGNLVYHILFAFSKCPSSPFTPWCLLE